jgi:hypothetical protein
LGVDAASYDDSSPDSSTLSAVCCKAPHKLSVRVERSKVAVIDSPARSASAR